MVLPTYNTWLS